MHQQRDKVEIIRGALLAARAVTKFVKLCEVEGLASKNTAFHAITADRFDLDSHQHRSVVRRAIKYLQDSGRLIGWDVDEIMPEFIPQEVAA